jgi:isoleucyl-tRNA synthetase
MPYGQIHYPFENADWFHDNFPADFIVEYIGQTRGWFYTLIVLSTALFDQPPFLNAIAHGILLGSDGRKLSKRLRNYPDVDEVLSNYGADALRLYLMGHPVIDGNDSSVTEAGIADMLRRFIIPMWNAFSFFTRYAEIDGWRPERGEQAHGDAIAADATAAELASLDRWIRSRTYALAYQMQDTLAHYDLRGGVHLLLDFVDDLNNWYIRRSRERFWKAEKDADKAAAYQTLHDVLVLLTKTAAPFVPFVTDVMYKNLTGGESVHLEDWPQPDKARIDEALNRKMAEVRRIASLGLAARAKVEMKVRQPLAKVSVKTSQALDETGLVLLMDELNVKEVELLDDVSQYAEAVARPQGSIIGPKYGRDTSRIIAAVKQGNFEALPDGRFKVDGNDNWLLEPEAVDVHYEAKPGYAAETRADLVVVLDLHLTDALKQEGLAREIVRHIQTLRKEADYHLDDRIVAGLFTADAGLQAALASFDGYIRAEVLADQLLLDGANAAKDWDLRKSLKVEGAVFELAVRGAGE